MSKRTMDLAPSDVHAPGAMKGGKKAKAGKGDKDAPADPKKPRKRRMHLSIRHPDHGRLELHLRHWGESVALGDAVSLADAGAGPVWIQLAKVGQFAGHPAGPFQLTPREFSEMVANFKATQNRRVPIDFEHASEADPTSGAVPTDGAPAQGWIVDLDNRGDAGLWGLVEWGDKAREYIRSGQYRYISPAVRFNSKDRVSGRPIGARLTSAGLTNQPFLDGMAPLAAKDATMSNTFAYSTHEAFPALRAAMRLPDTATPAEMKAQCARLRELCDMADSPTGMAHGVDLSTYLPAMRDAMRLPMSGTWDDLFDLIEDLIDAAIDQHEITHHGGSDEGADMTDRGTPGEGASAPERDTTMADENLSIKLRDAEAKAAETVAKLSDALTKNTELSLTLKEKDATIDSLKGEIAALKDAEEKRALADREREVDEAIAAHGAKKGISQDDKPALLTLLSANVEAFRKLYPKVDADKRHLMTNITGTREAPAKELAASPNAKLDVVSVAKALMRDDKSLSYESALNKAARIKARG